MHEKTVNKKVTVIPFVLRFTAVHFVTYLVFGVSFMLLTNYFEYFDADPLLSLVMRPSDDPMVQSSVFFQLGRGVLLALAIFPFREVLLERRLGWLKLFFMLFALTGIGAVITGPGSIEGFIYTKFSFNPLIGYPEVSLQMLAFSWLFCRWQGRKSILNVKRNIELEKIT